MKWFKHFSMAHADDKIVSIRARFGMWGIGTYWTLVERTAEQMKGETPSPTSSLLVTELCSFLGCKRNKLISFLDHLQNLKGIKYTLEKGNSELIKIEIPKIAEFADNYTGFDGLSTKRLQRQKEMSTKCLSTEEEVEVDKKKIKNNVERNPLPAALDFPEVKDALSRFETHRQEKKRPLTNLAYNSVIKKLEILSGGKKLIAIDILETSIANGWQGIFEPKGNNNERNLSGNKRGNDRNQGRRTSPDDYSGVKETFIH